MKKHCITCFVEIEINAERIGILTVVCTLTMCQWRGRMQYITLSEIRKDSHSLITETNKQTTYVRQFHWFNRIHACNKKQNTILVSQGTLIQQTFCRHFKWTPEIWKTNTPKPRIIRMAFCMISRSRFGVRSTFPSTARLEAQASRQREKTGKQTGVT